MTYQFVAAQHAAMHSHPPMLVVNLGVGRQKVTWADGTTQIVDLNPGAVVWREHAFDHAWELLAGEVDVILVESGRQTSGNKTSVRQMPFVSGSFVEVVLAGGGRDLGPVAVGRAGSAAQWRLSLLGFDELVRCRHRVRK